MSGGCAAVFRMKHSHGLVTEVKFLILLLKTSRRGAVLSGTARADSCCSWGQETQATSVLFQPIHRRAAQAISAPGGREGPWGARTRRPARALVLSSVCRQQLRPLRTMGGACPQPSWPWRPQCLRLSRTLVGSLPSREWLPVSRPSSCSRCAV